MSNPEAIMQALTANTHPTHRWLPEDDVLSCDNCGVRTYHKDARVLCQGTVDEHSPRAEHSPDLSLYETSRRNWWKIRGHTPMFISADDRGSVHGCTRCSTMAVITLSRVARSTSNRALDAACNPKGTV